MCFTGVVDSYSIFLGVLLWKTTYTSFLTAQEVTRNQSNETILLARWGQLDEAVQYPNIRRGVAGLGRPLLWKSRPVLDRQETEARRSAATAERGARDPASVLSFASSKERSRNSRRQALDSHGILPVEL